MHTLTKEISHCQNLKGKQLFMDSSCKEKCILLHNLILWDDLVETYVVLGKTEFLLKLYMLDEENVPEIRENQKYQLVFPYSKEAKLDLEVFYYGFIDEKGIYPVHEKHLKIVGAIVLLFSYCFLN